VAYLTPRERDAILRRNEANRPPELKAGNPPAKISPPAKEKDTLLRLVGGIPDGVVSDLFRVEGCISSAAIRWFSVAVVEFRPDGIPRHVEIHVEPSGTACHRTASTLFAMSLAPESMADPSRERAPYLASFNPKVFRCTAPPPEPSASADLLLVRGKVQAPRLVERVEPLYPKEQRRKGEQGVSVYEAIINTFGCIEDLRLIRSSTPVLDIMGMEAVSQWAYRPGTLNGQPVRVFLTVTVTYRLN
jgi:TonB family protein